MSDAVPPPWVTCSEISNRWQGVGVHRVVSIVSLLGLGASSSKHVRGRADKPEFSPAAVGLIERELRSRGHKRAAPPPWTPPPDAVAWDCSSCGSGWWLTEAEAAAGCPGAHPTLCGEHLHQRPAPLPPAPEP